MAEVVLENLVKTFPGGVIAVNDVSLRVEDREFVVLVGPSGCGKSTTLRMIAGLEEITRGTIRIGPRVVNDIAPKDRNIAMVFQNYALYPHMSVYRNMAFGLMLRRRYAPLGRPFAWLLSADYRARARQERTDIDRRVRQAAALLEIEPLLDRRPRELSGGQRQRVAVGRAIVREPLVYLFDEPLSNLDAKLRVEMRAELKRLHRRVQTTTIYVTHDQEEAMTLGDRIVVMKDGVVQQYSTPLEAYERPANRFVAGFVGSPPMNFFSGTLERDGAALWFNEGSFRLRLAPRVAQAVAASGGGPQVTLGVRPESLRVDASAGEDASLSVEVSVIEPLGDRCDLHATTPRGAKLTARVDARSGVREGQRVRLAVDGERVHVFARDGTERNLALA